MASFDWSSFLYSALGAAGGSVLVLGALAGWLGGVWKDRIARVETLLGQIDTDLRGHRLKVYPELWQAMAFLPKWPRDDGVSYEQLLEFSKWLRHWYFFTGGMFLSRSSRRDGYGPLQDGIAEILQARPTGPLSTEHYDRVRERCSRLRTLLTADIESRREGISASSSRYGA